MRHLKIRMVPVFQSSDRNALLFYRGRVIIEGSKRAKLFSWAETAKKTIAVYRECLPF